MVVPDQLFLLYLVQRKRYKTQWECFFFNLLIFNDIFTSFFHYSDSRCCSWSPVINVSQPSPASFTFCHMTCNALLAKTNNRVVCLTSDIYGSILSAINFTFSLTCCLTILQCEKVVSISSATTVNERLALSTSLIKVIFWDVDSARALILRKKTEASRT